MSLAPRQLEAIYRERFAGRGEYRNRVWGVLLERFFAQFISPAATVLDLGCGHGEFINQVRCLVKYGMDLNPETRRLLAPDVHFLHQDCSGPWPLPVGSLDVVFTSNFFEHLPEKHTLGRTLAEAFRCLRPGGRLIAMGPNIRHLPAVYWDFCDHYLALTDRSLSEELRTHGFEIEICRPRFLPYTMVRSPEYPLFLIRAYLALPVLWRLLGKQFLLVGVRKADGEQLA